MRQAPIKKHIKTGVAEKRSTKQKKTPKQERKHELIHGNIPDV